MTNDDDKKWLYNKLKNQGYNIGTYDDFSSSLNNEEDRKWYYDKASSMKLNVGTYDDFNKMFGTTTTEEAPTAPADTVAATMPKDTVPTKPAVQTQVASESQQRDKERVDAWRNWVDSASQQWQPSSLPTEEIVPPLRPREGRAEEHEKPFKDSGKPVLRRRPSLREQVEKPQFPAMEDAPWMKERGHDGLLTIEDERDRLNEAYMRGDFEPLNHREEDARIRKEYTPKKVVNEADIMENAKNRFALTERGQELQNELASIREEKTKKYMDEFMSSDEYKAIASRKPKTQEEADAVNNAVNDLFSQKYEGRIEEEMQPYYDAYRDEILSRNELEIKAELTKLGKKNTSEQVAGLTEEVNALLQKEHEELRRHGGSGNNAMNALMGSTQYNQATGERRKEIGALEAADKLLEESQEIINEAGKKGNTNFVSGLGRGLRDNVFELDNWTLGLAEMADAKYLNNALEKAERGEKLTPAEEKLLDASTINMATQAYFSSDLGRGYKAGQVTAESIPFMLEFIANPISGSGNAMAKGLLKYGLKKFGSVATTKGAKIAGRLIGDSAAALGMEGTTGIGRVAAGTLDRMNQNYETKFNDDGEVEVRKTGDMGMGEAFSRSAASTFFENQSEMIFNAFKTGGRRAAKKAISEAAPGMSGRIADKIANFYNKVKNNKTLKSVSDRAQFHGILEEYAEEAYNNMMNVAMGEMSMEDAISVDKNIDTFLGLAPTSLAFSALGIGGLATENVVAKKRLRKFMDGLDEHDRAAFSKFWEEIKTGNDEKAKNAVKSILDDKSLPAQAKKDMIFAVKDMVNVRNTEEMTDGVEDDPIIADATEAYNDGYSEEEPAGMQDTKKLYEHRKGEMAKMLGVEIDAVDEEIGDPVNYLGILPKLGREDQTQAVLDYINAKAAYDGMIQRVRDDIEGRIEKSNAMVDERTNKKTGMLQGVTMKVQDAEHNDRRAYVLDGNLVLLPDGTGIDHEKSDGSIIICDAQTGEMEMVSPDAIFSVEQPVDPETEKQTAAENIRQTFGKEAADKIEGIVAFNPGEIYTIPSKEGMVQVTIAANEQGVVDNGDGTVNVTDGANIFPLAKETIQQQVDAANKARIAQSEQQRQQAMQKAGRPQYAFNDRVTLQDEDGNIIHGQIAEYNDVDDMFVVDVDKEIDGKFAVNLTRERLDGMVVEYNGQPVRKPTTPATSVQTPQPEAPQTSVVTQGSVPADYVPDMELTVLDGGTEKPAMVMGRVREENGTYVPDENGGIVEYYMDGEVKYDPIGKLNGMVVSHKTAEPAAQAGVMTSQDAAIPPETDVQQPAVPALDRIPKDEQGNPVYEQAETPDLAWDAIVEQTDGDEVMAQTVADGMVADKESALKKLEKAKPRGGVTVAEKIAAEKERKAAIDAASHELDIWKKIAGTSNRRKQEVEAERRRVAEEAAARQKAEDERMRAEREEAERIEREALNGVPDMVDDTPQDARARGYRRVDGHKIDRQEPVQAVLGKEVAVKFSDDITPGGRVAVIDAGQLQPSHIQGVRNPLHFIDEAQPKERNDEASVLSARKIAENIRPEEITSSITAYTGAPTVNMRGEVIQGNNRSSALREMWNSQPEQSAKYKQYLIDHAQEFGLNAEDVIGMQRPVLVNMLDVDDTGAITLGQYTAQDTESGGTERIKPKNVLQRMHNDMRSFANLLLASGDEETSFAGLVDNNGVEVLKWMSQKGYITPTQYKSAFDSKGNLTAEAKNDLRGIMYQSIFKGASTRLEEMFNALPAKAQKAILATAFRDYDSPNAERMIEDIQDSIRAYYSLALYKPFVEAKNWKEARMAVEEWKRQYQLDDVSGESYLPAENFSNFALHLATMYKGETQRNIQDTFNRLYDLIQGTQEADLFKQPDNTPRTLAQAIKEVLNIDYNGRQRSNVLGGNITTGQRGKRGSAGDVAAGERAASGEQSTDDRGGTEIDSGLSRRDGTQETGSVRQSASLDEEARGQSIRLTSEGSDRLLAQMEEKADVVPNVELTPTAWRDSFGDSGFIDTPMGRVKMGENQITKFFAKGREKEFGMVAPTLSNPDIVIEKTAPEQNAERDTKLLFTKTFIKPDGSRYVHFESVTVLKDGMEVSISSHEASRNALKKEMQNGLILHLNKNLSLSSEWYLTETPAKEEPDLVPTSDNNISSSEGGTSSISHADKATPAISLQSRDDVISQETVDKTEREDGQLLILPSVTSEEAGALSSPTFGLPSASKNSASPSEKQEKGAENSADANEAGKKKGKSPYEVALEELGDIEQEWNDKIIDYVAEHYPTQATISAKTNSPQGLKEKAAMEKDETLKRMRAEAKAAIDAADEKVTALYKEEQEDEKKNSVRDNTMDTGTTSNGSKRNDTETLERRGVKPQRIGENAPVTKKEKALVNAIVGVLRKMGLKVFDDAETGQRVLDWMNGKGERVSAEKKRALETASLGSNPRSLTVVPSADGTKILNNLDNLTDVLEKSATQPKTFIGDLAKAIGASAKGSSSQYATFETQNGQIVTIRLANHNASSKKMDDAGRYNAISIVISPKPNQGILDDGNAHIVEFYYNPIKLRKADGKPLAEIVRSIKQALYSGEYKDTTGLAEVQEMNAETIREHRVFHGSGADFDAFDHSHMGEGEGAQAYGWGSYVTEVEGIGRTYAEKLTQAKIQGSEEARKIEERIEDIHLLQNYISAIQEEELMYIPKETRERFVSVLNEWVKNTVQTNEVEAVEEWLKKKGGKLTEEQKEELKNANEELEKEEKELIDKLDGVGQRHLYTVEIPDDTGSNYLDWVGKPTGEQFLAITTQAEKERLDGLYYRDKNGNLIYNGSRRDGEWLYKELRRELNSDKAVSEFLSRAGFTGIKYPAEATTGGRKDGAKNYVIFKESDMKITDHVRFFKTADGEAYGFTVGGKIYLDPRMAKADTPVHEYTHLWADALRQVNPKEWKNIVELMKGTPVWEEVKRAYPELETDDEIADEVLATYSGQRGAERLREEQRKIAESGASVLEKAEAISVLERVKDALKKFWKNVADFLHIHFTTAEEVADRVLSDLLNGVNPLDYTRADRRLRMQEQAEEQAIIEQAKANGTYMKAPNGKPTNLTEKQWMQVRTKAFKKWFGDWEKAARIEKLRHSEPITVSGDEYKGRYELNPKEASRYILDELRGDYVNKDTGDTIRISRKGAEKVMKHDVESDAHLKSAAYIPQMIENAIFITEEPNTKSNTGFNSYRYYVVGMNMGGTDYTVKLVVGMKDGQAYYDHALTEIEKNNLIESIDPINTGFANNETGSDNPLSDIKDKRLLSILQTNSSKVVDENGEPLVVYHGTTANFTVFKPSEDGALGPGIYLTGDEGFAKTVQPGSHAMPLFANIRNPKTAQGPGEQNLSPENDGIYAPGPGFWVAVSPNQLKDAYDNTGAFSAENDDIRYSRKSDAQEKRDLVAVHNITAEKLAQAFELGGFPMPSIAVTKADVGHTTFGDISLVFGKESIDPSDRRNKVYGEDAWTPVFPQVGYKLNEEKTSDIYRRANKAGRLLMFNPSHLHPDNLQNKIDRLDSKSVADSFKNDYGMKQLYLSENGNAVKEFEQHEVEKYPEASIGLFEKMLEGIGLERLKNDNLDALRDEIKPLIAQHKGIDFDGIKPYRAKVIVDNSIRNAIDYAENGNKRLESDVEATQKKIDERIDPKKYGAWLEDLFAGIVEKKGIRNDKDPFTPSGNSRKWEELYDRITLDNVVKGMQQQAAHGGHGLFGGSIFGAAQEEYKSIDEIREAARDRIRTIDEADYKSQRDAITDRLSAIKIPGVGESFSDTMDMVQNIQDAVARSHTPKGIHKYLKEFYPRVTMQTANEIADIVKDIQKMTARYFEAKPYRSVGFDEVRLAVVPSDADANLVAELEKRGIPVRRYEKGNEDERRQIVEAATDEMDLRFRQAEETKAGGQDLGAMREEVERTAEKLHLEGVEIVTDTSGLQGRKARAKGFYNPKTGKITIVLPNNANVEDAVKTLLHEAVAHHGLRKLFGEHFDTFLDEVFNNASEDVRRQIVELAKRHGWNFRTATEEYLASLAESTDFENMHPSLWRKIKELFLDMLRKAGIDLRTYNDNELRYILWRSYEDLRGDTGVFREAADIAKQYELKVGEYAERDSDNGGNRNAVPESIREASERFNEELSSLTEANADNTILSLGRPSAVLRAAGVEDKPMKLYGNKVIKKMKKHGFTLEELRDLPHAVADPIAVFDNYAKDGNRSILTELRTEQGNFLVTIDLGKGEMDTDFNVVTSVFGKGDNKVVNWINKGFATYVNKEKALNYLHHSAPIAEALSSPRLISATKIIENFENPNIEEENVGDEVLFRDGDPEVHERALARDRYEKRVKSGMFQSREALQDSMLSLKEAMDAILGKKTFVEDVEGFENAYIGENRLSSTSKAEADAFANLLFKPLLDVVAKLAPNETERRILTDYMMAKHGLERNVYMAERDAQVTFDENSKAHPTSKKTLQDFIDKFRQKDYAGLTALTGMDDVADAEAEAQRMVDEYEAAHETADLWDKVNAVNKATLMKLYECGLMNKETFDKISGMYEYYIPLRGFDETTSAEAYAYLTHKESAFNAPIKKAEGRRSKADDPFAYMQSMAESAIMQGNRNKLVKQRFLNFVLNHPSDLVSVSDLWLQYDDVADEWKPVFPDNIEDTDTPEDVERKMQEFETKMQALAKAEPDRYKGGKDAVNIPYRVVESRDLRQHQVIVKRNGRDIVLTVNGNPRLAQALNGQTNPDNDMTGAIGAILQAGEAVNRQLSAFYTTRNPDFIVSNFLRDMLYANSMVWIKENPNYARRFNRNCMLANPAMMKILMAKHRKGTLDMSDKIEKMFHQFMMNGGETGYASIRDIEKRKNDIQRELKKLNGRMPVNKALGLLGERLDEYNRAIENCARFAAFMTSREMGRSLDRAIHDAKEISVNFNKKGSGAKFLGSTGQTKAGNAAAMVSGLGRAFYVFWNAAIQGTTNFGRQAKRHPAKAFTGIAAMFLLGALVASLGGDDDDDDKNAYYNLPEYVRRSHILFRAGDSWISIPLPVEYRSVYGLGELMTSVLSGKEHLTGGEIGEAIAAQVSQVLPLDFMEGGGGMKAFVPSSVKPLVEAYIMEKSWTGMPLYKDTPFNKDMPEWTKAYKSANKHLVNLAAVLNEVSGGDRYTKGAIDINPAKVEYLLNGYFGGVSSTIDKMTKMAETLAGKREYDPRSFLLLNRVVKTGDERTEYRAVNNEYFRLKEEHDRIGMRLRNYENDTDNGIFDYAEKIDFLYNSPEYERYEIFEDYRRDIDALYEEMKETVDDGERKDIEVELNELKKEMIQEMNLTRKRK